MQIQQLAFTTRQMNSVERTPQIFNVAVICSLLSQLRSVREAIARCFDHVEELYFYDKTMSCAGIYDNICLMHGSLYMHVDHLASVCIYITFIYILYLLAVSMAK